MKTKTRLFVFAALAAALLGSTELYADGTATMGRAILTIEGGGTSGPAEALRYEVDAVFSSEASSFEGGILCRFELPQVVDRNLGVVVLDFVESELAAAQRLPLDHPAVLLRYHELSPSANLTFQGVAENGEIELVRESTTRPGLSLHLAFHAEIVSSTDDGGRRIIDQGEAQTAAPAQVDNGGVTWRSSDQPDYVDTEIAYYPVDCGGDPIYDPYYDDDWDSDDDWDGWSGDNDWDDWDPSDDDSWDSWDYDDAETDYDSSGDCDSGDDVGDDSGSCDGGGDDWGEDSGGCGSDSDIETDCSTVSHVDRRGRVVRRVRRSRLWNAAPFLAALAFWAFLRTRRREDDEPLPALAESAGR